MQSKVTVYQYISTK